MNHKRKGPKQTRAGCMMCKWYKLSTIRTADRMKARLNWKKDWANNS